MMKTMKPNTKALTCLVALTLATVTAFFSGGCKNISLTTVTKADILTALEITAAITIGDDLRKAEAALDIVSDARRYIREGEQISAVGVIDYIAGKVLAASDLNAGSRLAISRLLARYQHNFTLEIDQVGLSPDMLVTVSEALDSIELVAREILENGDAAPRSYSTVATPQSRPASPAHEPIDYSLWGWITKPETRAATKAYYAPTDPEQIKRVTDLKALDIATDPETGNVDGTIYRRYAY